MLEKPVFKKKEVVVEKPEIKGIQLSVEECIATILYVGEKTEDYKVGDKIIFSQKFGRDLKYFGKPLWVIENEGYITCKVETE